MKSTTSTMFTLILLGVVCLSPYAFAATSETVVADQTNTVPVEGETVTVAIDGTEETAPLSLASIGRLVEKKGYGDLLAALALLPTDLSWHLTHIGGGPLAGSLAKQAERLGLAGKIEWLGRRPQSRARSGGLGRTICPVRPCRLVWCGEDGLE